MQAICPPSSTQQAIKKNTTIYNDSAIEQEKRNEQKRKLQMKRKNVMPQ